MILAQITSATISISYGGECVAHLRAGKQVLDTTIRSLDKDLFVSILRSLHIRAFTISRDGDVLEVVERINEANP